MNIYFNTISHSISSYKDRFTSSLTARQKMIASLALFALSCLVVGYYCFRKFTQVKELPEPLPSKPHTNKQKSETTEKPPVTSTFPIQKPVQQEPASENQSTSTLEQPKLNKEKPTQMNLETIVSNLPFGPHATKNEKEGMRKILINIFKFAKIEEWKQTEKPNEYQLKLANEVILGDPKSDKIKIILKNKIKIIFEEEMIPETKCYRQIMTFPDKGVCLRIGSGFFSMDFNKIPIETNEKGEIQTWVDAGLLGKHTKSINEFTMRLGNLQVIT